MEKRTIETIRSNLELLFPHEAHYGSISSLFGKGLENGVVTSEEYEQAKRYYGKLWRYVGD